MFDVSSQAPAQLPGPDLDEYRRWKPEAQARALQLLEERSAQPWRPFYCTTTGCNGHAHCVPADPKKDCEDPRGHPWSDDDDQWHMGGQWHCEACGMPGTLVDKWAWEHARVDQHPPRWRDDWLTLLLSGGRGSGKTRTGAELTHRVTNITPRIILIAPTGPDLRATMIEGMSGILATSPPNGRPEWEPSKKQLTWPNGCIGQGFSAEEPDRLRGPQSGFIWADEPAFYPDTERVMDNALFGHRVKNKKGYDPKVVCTTTPKPTAWMRKTVADEETVIHRVSTYANLRNLAPKFRQRVLRKYEGTRTGRQELHGELIEDVEGALWKWDMFKRTTALPEMVRIVVALDPAGTANARSDQTGIIVVGLGADRLLYVLADYTSKYSPAGWADKTVWAYEKFSADAIVAEKNYGGDMVKHTLENSKEAKALIPRIILVDSRRGKAIRAEPVVALYEKNKVWHYADDPDIPEDEHLVRTNLSEVEDEQTSWVPGPGSPSPNRVDALVHGITELGGKVMPAEFADPRSLNQFHGPADSMALESVGGFAGPGLGSGY